MTPIKRLFMSNAGRLQPPNGSFAASIHPVCSLQTFQIRWEIIIGNDVFSKTDKYNKDR